jgi:hypothetical protein
VSAVVNVARATVTTADTEGAERAQSFVNLGHYHEYYSCLFVRVKFTYLIKKWYQKLLSRAKLKVAMARAFAADAVPMQTEFVRRGLPDGFLGDLNDDIEEFEGVINLKIQRREA